MTGRGVARALGKKSPTGVAEALKYLVSGGVVIREDHPPAALYRLNREHVAAEAVEALAELRAILINRIATEVESWDPAPTWVAIFGSAARGDGAADSDMDIAVVGPEGLDQDSATWIDQIHRLNDLVRVWTGNQAAILSFDMKEFARSSLMEEILNDAVTVMGRRPRRSVM